MLRWLNDKLGLNQQDRKNLTREIMNLRKCKSLERFEQKNGILRAKVLGQHDMERYYDDFVETLREFVLRPSLEDPTEFIDTDFKTNRYV